jgi:hypothetical protein
VSLLALLKLLLDLLLLDLPLLLLLGLPTASSAPTCRLTLQEQPACLRV